MSNTRAFIITKYLIKEHSFLVAQVISALIEQLPEKDLRFKEENSSIWFKPDMKPLIKKSGQSSSTWWEGVKKSIETGLLQKEWYKGRQYFSINFAELDKVYLSLDVEEEENTAIAQLEEIAEKLKTNEETTI